MKAKEIEGDYADDDEAVKTSPLTNNPAYDTSLPPMQEN